jgi:hypothetical protein
MVNLKLRHSVAIVMQGGDGTRSTIQTGMNGKQK